MKGITLGVASDTNTFRKGIETGVIKPVEEADKALEKLAESRPMALIDDLEDAQRETEELKRETKQTADAIDREYRDSYRRAKQSSDDFTDKAKAGAGELKDELKQSAAEGAASFSGEMDDVVDVVQETIANGLSGFGPVGALAGLALAAGIGAGFSEIQKQAEATQQFIEDAFDDMAENASSSLSRAFVAEQMKTLLQDEGKRNEIKEQSVALSLSEQTVLQAMAGDAQSLQAVQEAINGKLGEINGKYTDANGQLDTYARHHDTAYQRIEMIRGGYEGIITNIDTAVGRASLYNSALGTGNATLDAGLQKIRDTSKEIDKLSEKTPTVTLRVDDSALERAITRQQGRTIQFNLEGQVTRIGNQVW